MSDPFSGAGAGNIGGATVSGAATGSMISPGWGTVIGAGIGAGSSILGGLMGSGSQSATNAQSFQQAEMLFDQQQNSIPRSQQYAMENAYNLRGTAYQATMDDMRRAGLNPILAANLGPTAASIGGSSMPSIAAPPVGNPGAAMADAFGNAGRVFASAPGMYQAFQAAKKDETQADLNDVSQDLTRKLGHKAEQDTRVGEANETNIKSDTVKKLAETAYTAAQTTSAGTLNELNKRILADTTIAGDSPISKAVMGIVRMLNTSSGNPGSNRPGDLKSLFKDHRNNPGSSQ